MIAPVELSVNLAPKRDKGLVLRNPVMIASGTFGSDGYGKGQLTWPLDELGAVVSKTITLCYRQGNDEPRRFPDSFQDGLSSTEPLLLNSYGLNNLGFEAAISKYVPKWNATNATVVLSISALEDEQWEELAALTRGVDFFSAIELNLSCPNIKKRELFSHHAKDTEAVVDGVRRQTDLPIWAKLSPNVPNIEDIACAAERAGADALTIANTMPALHIDVDSWTPVLGAGHGGLSGPAMRYISLGLVHRASQVVGIPIIGVGGVITGHHAAEYLLAGASAVQVGSANKADFRTPFRVLTELETLLNQWEVSNVSDIIGAATFP